MEGNKELHMVFDWGLLLLETDYFGALAGWGSKLFCRCRRLLASLFLDPPSGCKIMGTGQTTVSKLFLVFLFVNQAFDAYQSAKAIP